MFNFSYGYCKLASEQVFDKGNFKYPLSMLFAAGYPADSRFFIRCCYDIGCGGYSRGRVFCRDSSST